MKASTKTECLIKTTKRSSLLSIHQTKVPNQKMSWRLKEPTLIISQTHKANHSLQGTSTRCRSSAATCSKRRLRRTQISCPNWKGPRDHSETIKLRLKINSKTWKVTQLRSTRRCLLPACDCWQMLVQSRMIMCWRCKILGK